MSRGLLSSRLVQACRYQSSGSRPLYLDPHKWKGLPADRIFALHDLRVQALGKNYQPSEAERTAIFDTFSNLARSPPKLGYCYEIDNFKERLMNNVPLKDRNRPPQLSNVRVFAKGETPHEQRKIEQLHRVTAYEMPLLAKFRQPYTPPAASQNPIQFQFNTDFQDEPTVANRKVSLTVKAKRLGLDQKQMKKFKLLSGNKFNHNTGEFRLSTSRFPESAQNARWLVETFNVLLSESKDTTKNTFDGVPVDTRHSRPLKKTPLFPEEWKRPQDAPIKRHQIVTSCVEAAKRTLHKEHLKSLAP